MTWPVNVLRYLGDTGKLFILSVSRQELTRENARNILAAPFFSPSLVYLFIYLFFLICCTNAAVGECEMFSHPGRTVEYVDLA